MKRRLPLLMLIHQRKWKKPSPPRSSYTLGNTESFCSSQPNSSSSSVESLMSASDYMEMPSDWKEQLLKNPSSLTTATTQPCNNAFKIRVLLTSAGLIFFPTLDIVTLLLRVPWGYLLDLGTISVKGMCQIRSFFKQLSLRCTQSLLLSSLERGRARCCL